MADKASSPTKVQFPDDVGEKPHHLKHVPTQKYDRKEISKRLEIEQWMEEQLKDLFETEVGLNVNIFTATLQFKHDVSESMLISIHVSS